MIEQLIKEVEKSLDNECYFAALTLALTLPDACGKAEYRTKCNKKRYMDWCKKYIDICTPSTSPYAADMLYLSNEILYQLRCDMLHQSTPGVEKKEIKEEERCQVDEFVLSYHAKDIFSENGLSMVSYGANMQVVYKKYKIGIEYLCYKLCKSAQEYYENNKDKFDFINYHLEDLKEEDYYESTISNVQ